MIEHSIAAVAANVNHIRNVVSRSLCSIVNSSKLTRWAISTWTTGNGKNFRTTFDISVVAATESAKCAADVNQRRRWRISGHRSAVSTHGTIRVRVRIQSRLTAVTGRCEKHSSRVAAFLPLQGVVCSGWTAGPWRQMPGITAESVLILIASHGFARQLNGRRWWRMGMLFGWWCRWAYNVNVRHSVKQRHRMEMWPIGWQNGCLCAGHYSRPDRLCSSNNMQTNRSELVKTSPYIAHQRQNRPWCTAYISTVKSVLSNSPKTELAWTKITQMFR